MAISSNDPIIERSSSGRLSYAGIALGTAAAIVAATIVNVIVFYIGDAAGAFPDDFRFAPPGGGETSLGVGNVILSTIMFLALGGIVFAIINRFSSRPVRIFIYVAIAACLLSFIQPFTIEDAPGDMIAFLLVMHVLAAIVGVWVMTRVAVQRG